MPKVISKPEKSGKREKTVTINISFPDSAFARIEKYRKSVSLPASQDVIRLATSQFLLKNGY